MATLAAGALAVGAVAFVVLGGGEKDSSASVAAPASPPKAKPTPPTPPKPTFTAADWTQANELAELAKAKSAEADAARDRGDETARKGLRSEALRLYERAIGIWQKIDALSDAEQNDWNDRHGETVHRWVLAKRKLM
ncbi:MAG: hypothetical protein HYR85_06070 [Planctomycetes bacterium]|nr:hypothetical protein [Planctomycetota bacterium]